MAARHSWEHVGQLRQVKPGLPGWLALGVAAAIAVMATALAVVNPALGASTYESNLEMIRQSSVRNANHDDSRHRDTPQDQLVIENHLGPRSDYLTLPGGNSERSYPVDEGGQFRISCEFSHFAYDDPLVAPGRPGAAHLHMFFGNTDTNAHSTYETLINSGSSTCNGQELNRTAYWAPALFDNRGNVRIPMRIGVYYKGYGLARGAAQPYPEGAAVISKDIHRISWNLGGTDGPGTGETSFQCTDAFRSLPREPAGNLIPVCGDTNVYGNPTVLEHHIKFQNCLYGDDPADPDSWDVGTAGSWFYSLCEGGTTFPNIEYIIQYQLEPGESTEGWFLASDVDPASGSIGRAGDSTHGDWWGGWQPEVNRMWLDNCTNFATNRPSGCGHGYLTDGGPDGRNPLPGPALKLRPQYEGPRKVAAATLFDELCPRGAGITQSADAAHCNAGGPVPTTAPPTTVSPTTVPSTSSPSTTVAPPTTVSSTTSPPTTTPSTTGAPPTTSPVTSRPPVTEAPPATGTSTVITTPDDPATCQGLTPTLIGTEGDDDLRGTRGDDVIMAFGGDDTIRGAGGDDVICAGPGNDRVWGGRGSDVILGGPGADRISGGSDADRIHPGPGEDRVSWLQEFDVLVSDDGTTFSLGS